MSGSYLRSFSSEASTQSNSQTGRSQQRGSSLASIASLFGLDSPRSPSRSPLSIQRSGSRTSTASSGSAYSGFMSTGSARGSSFSGQGHVNSLPATFASPSAVQHGTVIDGDDAFHNWEWHTSFRPSFCAVCNRVLWAFARQGLQCTKCQLEVHDQCQGRAQPCQGEDIVALPEHPEEDDDTAETIDLIVTLVSASNLAKRSVMSGPDPFAILTNGHHNQRTAVAKKTANPAWASKHTFTARMSSTLYVAVYDNRRHSRNRVGPGGFLGVVAVPIANLLEQDMVAGVMMAYRLKKRHPADVVSGGLVLHFQYANPARDERVAVQYIQQVHLARARKLSHPMFTSQDDLLKNPEMHDLLSNMDTNVFGEKPPDNLPNAQLRSYGLDRSPFKVPKLAVDTLKLQANTTVEGGDQPLRRMLPPTPPSPACTVRSESSVHVSWQPQQIEDAGGSTGQTPVRYTLYRDGGTPKGQPLHLPPDDATQWVEEYVGPNTEHIAVAIHTGTLYRFRLRAANTYGSSDYGPWSEPIAPERREDPNRKKSEVREVVEDTRPHCPFYMAGFCHNGSQCPFSHGTGIQDEDDMAAAMLAAALNQDANAGMALAMAASLRDTSVMPIDTSNLSQFKRDLHNKQMRIRNKLRMPKGECHLTVVRNQMFASSFAEVMHRPTKELKKKLFVHFKGEGGLDYGGLAREWFFLLSHELYTPARGLFEFSDTQSYLLQLANTGSRVHQANAAAKEGAADGQEKSDGQAETEQSIEGANGTATGKSEAGGSMQSQTDCRYYQFVGRVMGLAVFHHHYIDAVFVTTFYKLLLGRTVELSDLEEIDPAMHQSMLWILSNSIDGALDLTFSVDALVNGHLVTVDLLPNGRNVAVTDENKNDFVLRMLQWRVHRGTERQMEALRGGFLEFVPAEVIQDLAPRELELLISGQTELDVADWRQNTLLKDYSERDQPVVWWWQLVEESNRDMRLRMLQFVTGTQRIPPEGFQALVGTDGPRKFCIQMVPDTSKLPSSHTCFNRLDLPPYKSYEEFREKVYTAVQGFQGFTGE